MVVGPTGGGGLMWQVTQMVELVVGALATNTY